MSKERLNKNKFWNFAHNEGDKTAELILDGEISSSESWWRDTITPKWFNSELADLGDVDEIVVRINSGGGDVFAANAIYTRLKDHKANITVKIDGWAASAATIIAMAGDTIKIPKNGVFMIHDPAMTIYDTFVAEEFEKMATELKVIKKSIVNAYEQKTGRSSEEISALMSAETWWTGDEAVSEGFCDELMFEEVETNIENKNIAVVNSVSMNLSNFRNVPKFILSKINTTNFKEDNKEMPENKITTVEQLRNACPELVKQIENSAAENERNRIKNIREIAIDGFEDIVEDAMFNNPINAETLALKIVNKQKSIGGQYINNRDSDIENSGVNNVSCSPNEGGDSKIDAFNAYLDKYYPETR